MLLSRREAPVFRDVHGYWIFCMSLIIITKITARDSKMNSVLGVPDVSRSLEVLGMMFLITLKLAPSRNFEVMVPKSRSM